MHSEAIDIKEFYQTAGGRVVKRILRSHIRRFWPDVKGMRVVGFGYAVPYLWPWLKDAERVVAMMPSQQGAIFWPSGHPNLVSLCDESSLPLESNSVDRFLMIHGGQDYDSFKAMLSEAYRVLSGQGSLLLIVPNRTGVWARFDHTPFGYGTPYSMRQLRQVLKSHMFVTEKTERGLFVPPASSRLMLAAAPVWEKIGMRFFNAFGGVNMIEAVKQVYAGTPVKVTSASEARRRFAPATSTSTSTSTSLSPSQSSCMKGK